MRYGNISKNTELDNNKVLALDNSGKLVSVDASGYNGITGQGLDIGGETFSTYKTIKALKDGVLNSIIVTSSTNSNGTVSIKLYHNGTLHSTVTYVGTYANGKYNKVFISPTDFIQIDFNKYDIIEIRVSDTGTSLSTDLNIILG